MTKQQTRGDAAHPPLCMFAVSISSLVRCAFTSFAHFLVKLFAFLLLRSFFSLYILDHSPLPDVFFANIFSQSVACLLILWTLRCLQMETRGQTVLNPKQDFSISVLLTSGAG